MKINSAHFVKGVRGTDDITDDGIKQLVFIGRSNVGKSSSINALLGRNNLVRSSSTPGKTQEVNFFLALNDVYGELYFVDLPGYGYAKLPGKSREKLGKLIDWFLFQTERAGRIVVVVTDAQVGITEYDQAVIDACKEEGIPIIILANKIDKLNQSDKTRILREYQESGLAVIAFSAAKKRGVSDFYDLVSEIYTQHIHS